MQIDPSRILAAIDAIASFSECAPAVGYSRPTFSDVWGKARDYVIDEARRSKCQVRIDAAGNVHVRPAKLSWDEKAWMSGSHIDSVPTGGKFDGVIGIICPLEILRAAHAAGRDDLPLELIIFAEEEGTTFGLGMIGSRLWVDDATPEHVGAFKNRDGRDFLEAGKAFGVDAGALLSGKFDPAPYRGLIEIHIEQGPSLWDEGKRIAVVDAIAGRKQFLIELTGVANHAGSTPMDKRSDALLAAANIAVGVEHLALSLANRTVATVGRIACEPNAVNVIAGKVQLTVDLRSPDDELINEGEKHLRALVNSAKARDRKITMTEDQPVVKMDAGLCDRLRAVAGADVSTTVSGALHDAAILAPRLPTAMLFVASKDGVSHNPAEFSRIEDIARAAEILAKLVES